MATVLARTVCLGFFLAGVGALREAMEAADINLDSDRCGGLRCFRAWDSGRLNQGRFQLRAGAAQRVSWRLVPEASYSLQKDSGCNGDAGTVVSSVQVLPWIHAEEPINGSTIEIFVPSVEDLVLRMNVKQNVFLCASRTFRQERSCLCQLDLIKSPSVGLLPQLGRLLPGKGFAQLAEVQVSLDRQCPAPWIPDVVVATVLALFAVFLLLSLEAAVAIKRAGPAENPRKLAEDAGLVVAKPLNLARKAGTGAVGFVTLMATTQGIAVTKAMDAQVPEAVVWLLVASAGLLSALAVWRSFQSTCQIQLSEAYLLNGQCIRNTPSVKSMDYALGAGILLYALAAAGGVLAAGTSAEQVGFMVLVLTALVGPVMNLLLRVKAGSDAETEAARVKMQPSGFEALLSRGSIAEKSTEGNFSWSFLHWEEVLAAGRQSRETRPETPGDEGIPSEGTPFGLLSDVLWQRQRIHKLTSSHAGFLVWPGCFFSLALAVASTAMQGMLFACSRGELASLEVTGLGQSIQFVKSQDHYVLGADKAVRQVSLYASAHEARSRHLTVEPPLTEARFSALSPVPIGGMMVPRVARVTIQGTNPSLPATEYLVRFAPQAKLAQVLLLEAPDLGFRRCLAWATLPGSQLSIPPEAKNLTATILFADFFLGVPLERHEAKNLEVAEDATWTVFHRRRNFSDCKTDCSDDPDCLASFEGTHGCFAAYHSYAWHESQSCSGAAKLEKGVSHDSFRAQMFGCVTRAGSLDSECGPDIQVQDQSARFESVSPDWQGGVSGQLRLKLRREQSLERRPVDAQAISLSKELPLPTDVLVKLIAENATGNATTVLHARGMVSKEGDIVVTASKFDPFLFRSLRLIVVPILPDTNFQVQWTSIPNDGTTMKDADLPDLKRCKQSMFLRLRYRACGATSWGARPSEPITFAFMPWAGPLEGRFLVEPRQPSEQRSGMWPRRPKQHRLKVRFDQADTPAAWAAREQGCELLHRVPKAKMHFVGRSADAFCAMVQGALSTGSCDYVELCEEWRTALAEHHRLPEAQVTTLLACQAEAQKLPWAQPCEWMNFSAWSYDRVTGTLQTPIQMPTFKVELKLPLSDFFESLNTLGEGLRPLGLAAAEIFCRTQPWQNFLFWRGKLGYSRRHGGQNGTLVPVEVGEKQVWFQWLLRAMHTGSLSLTRTIHDCISQEYRALGFDLLPGLGHMNGTLGAEAWAASTKLASKGLDHLSWLSFIGNMSDEMPQGIVKGALEHGSTMLDFRTTMKNLLPSWKHCRQLSSSLPRRLELEELAWVLQREPCNQVAVLKVSGGRIEDFAFPPNSHFFDALKSLSQLQSLSIRHWSLSALDMAELHEALKAREGHGQALDFFELKPRLGDPPFPRSALKELFGLCVHRFALGDFGLGSPGEVEAFISEVSQSQMPCLRSWEMQVTKEISNYTLLHQMHPRIEEALRTASGNSSAELIIRKDDSDHKAP